MTQFVVHRNPTLTLRSFDRPGDGWSPEGAIHAPEGCRLEPSIRTGRRYLVVPLEHGGRESWLSPSEAITAALAGEHRLRWVPAAAPAPALAGEVAS